MTNPLSRPCTAFEGDRLLASGPLIEVALAVKNAIERGWEKPVLVFDDATGAVVDLDLRGSKADITARLAQPAATAAPDSEPRRQGPPEAGGRRPRDHLAAAPLGMAGRAARRGFGDAAPAGRRGKAQRRRQAVEAQVARGCLPLHGGACRQPAWFRGGNSRAVCRRPRSFRQRWLQVGRRTCAPMRRGWLFRRSLRDQARRRLDRVTNFG